MVWPFGHFFGLFLTKNKHIGFLVIDQNLLSLELNDLNDVVKVFAHSECSGPRAVLRPPSDLRMRIHCAKTLLERLKNCKKIV